MFLEPQRQEYWESMSLIHHGRYAEGIEMLAMAGSDGVDRQRHLQLGMAIAQGLRDPDFSVRLGAVRRWEQWQVNHPGSWIWQRDETLVREAAQTEAVQVIATGVEYNGYRATAAEPVQLVVQGPVEMRIDVRPLHPANEVNSVVDDWVIVKTAGREYIWSILQNRPSTTLRAMDDRRVPGSLERVVLRLGPGRHELALTGGQSELLVRTSVRRPSEPLPVLPPLTPQTLKSVIDGRWGRIPAYPVRDPGKHHQVAHAYLLTSAGSSTTWESLPYVRQLAEYEFVSSGLPPDVSPVESAHRALRMLPTLTSEQATTLMEAGRDGDPLTAHEQLEIVARAGIELPSVEWGVDPTTIQTRQAMEIHAGQLDRALQIDPGSDAATTQLHTSLLLYRARMLEADETAAMMMSDWANRRPNDTSLAIQRDRLMNNGRWVLSREVTSSGGLMTVTSNPPAPHFQATQVRQALARPLPNLVADPDYILSGYRQVRFSVSDSRPVDFEVTLRQPKISYLPTPTLDIEIQLNERRPQSFRLDGAHRVVRGQLNLPPGDNEVMIRIKNPFLGQYVFVHLVERLPGNQRVPWAERKRTGRGQRLFHIATRDKPVVFRLTGPSWIRYEQLVDGAIHVRELMHAEGVRELVLTPPPGTDQALYRIWEFQRGTSTARPKPPRYVEPAEARRTPPPRWLDVALHDQQLPAPLTEGSVMQTQFQLPVDDLDTAALAPPNAGVRLIDLQEPFALGGQEDGTWGLGLGTYHRRPLEEGTTLIGAPDQFLQTRFIVQRIRHDRWRIHRHRWHPSISRIEWTYVGADARSLVPGRERCRSPCSSCPSSTSASASTLGIAPRSALWVHLRPAPPVIRYRGTVKTRSSRWALGIDGTTERM